jgi:CRISPR-associated RAMP protein (TIGR02581 family)
MTQNHDFTTFHSRLTVSGELELITPLRIGAGQGDDFGLADIAVVKNQRGLPYIPGSSVKGVLRSFIESFLRTIDPDLACLCVTTQTGFGCTTTKEPKDLAQYQKQFADEDAMYMDGTCRVCKVFGSNGMASKVQIPDLPLAGEWVGRYQLRNGVSIDRDTETAVPQRLFTIEAVPAGTRFKFELIIENGNEADQGLVLLGLAAFEREMVALGGATSRGLGQVKLHIKRCTEVPGDAQALFDYLVSGTAVTVDKEARQAKINALRDEVTNYA